MICDTLDQLHLYKGFHKNLDTAIEFLAAHPLDTLPLGRTEVDGDEVFINVMDADLKPHTGSHAEYHRLYADLQIDLTGGEGWGYETAPRHRGGALPAGYRQKGQRGCRFRRSGRGAVRPLLPR